MSPQDHNKTIMVLFSLIAIFPTILLCASPWIIANNVSSSPSPRRDEQIMIAAISMGIIIILVLWLWGAVVGLYRRKVWGRRMALVSCIPLLFYCPPVAVYTWWFLHSSDGKRLYSAVPASPSV
jgi:hypothetical protein